MEDWLSCNNYWVRNFTVPFGFLLLLPYKNAKISRLLLQISTPMKASATSYSQTNLYAQGIGFINFLNLGGCRTGYLC